MHARSRVVCHRATRHRSLFFFFNDTATTEIYTLSLHDALPILYCSTWSSAARTTSRSPGSRPRSEEHTSELQSHHDLVCRLLLEKQNTEGARHGRPHTPRDAVGLGALVPPR